MANDLHNRKTSDGGAECTGATAVVSPNIKSLDVETSEQTSKNFGRAASGGEKLARRDGDNFALVTDLLRLALEDPQDARAVELELLGYAKKAAWVRACENVAS